MCSLKPFLLKSVLLINLSSFFFEKNKKCFPPLYLELKPFRGQKGALSFRENVFILLFSFFKDISRFLFKHLFSVTLFFHPFFFLSLLDSLSLLFVSSPWIFLSSFFSSPFSLFFTLFSLFCFSSSFWCTFFWFLVLPSGCDCCLGLFLSPFASPVFFCLFNFFEKKKKLRFEKSHPFFCESFFSFFFNNKNSVFFLNFPFSYSPFFTKQQCFSKKHVSFCNCLFFFEQKLCSLFVGSSKDKECSSVFSVSSCFSLLSKVAK